MYTAQVTLHLTSSSPQLYWLCNACCAGYQAEAGQRLQPYADHLVYSAAVALPWMAPELQQLGSDPEGLLTLASSIEQYIGLRQSHTQQALNAFPAATSDDEAAASLTSRGVAEFLPEVGGCVHVGCDTLPHWLNGQL